jgi:1-deoxy-D-xylulose-5-phosphate synthase
MIQELLEKEHLEVTHLDMRFLKPLDLKAVAAIFCDHDHIITIEDGTVVGGLGSSICDLAFIIDPATNKKTYQGNIYKLGIPDSFIDHGPTAALHKITGIDYDSVLKLIKKLKAINN